MRSPLHAQQEQIEWRQSIDKHIIAQAFFGPNFITSKPSPISRTMYSQAPALGATLKTHLNTESA